MLVLSRREKETLIIGDGQVKVTIVDIGSNQVKIGVEAPKHIAVNREEIYDKIKTEGGTLGRL